MNLRSIVKRFEKEFFAPLDPEQHEALQALLLRLASHHDARYSADEPS
jgi:hypothetical protein